MVQYFLSRLQMSRKLRSNGMANTVTKFQQNGAIWPSFRFEGRWDGSLKRSELPSKEAAVYLVDRRLALTPEMVLILM
jgi:hypothetical protein